MRLALNLGSPEDILRCRQNSPAQRPSGGLGTQMSGSGMPVTTSLLPHCPLTNQGSQNPILCSSVNDKSWSPYLMFSSLGVAPCPPFVLRPRLGMRTRFFNLWLLLLLLLLLRIWLYRRRTQPLPTTGVSFQATQDIFSLCSPHVPFSSELPCCQPSPPPRRTPMRVGF